MMKNILLSSIIVIGLVILYWSGSILKQSRESLNWPQTKGNMISSLLTIDHLPKFIDYRANPARWYGVQVQYEYKVGDGSYLSDRLSFHATGTRNPAAALNVLNKYRNQRTVTVYYDPKDPQEAVLEPGNIGNLYLMLILGGLLVLGGLFILYRQSLEFHDKAGSYIHQGDIYQHQGKSAEALVQYDYAVRVDPSSAVGYTRRGAVYLQARNWDQAIADFNQAIILSPRDSLAYFALANAYLGKKEYDRALVNMQKAMERGFNVDPEILEGIKKNARLS